MVLSVSRSWAATAYCCSSSESFAVSSSRLTPDWEESESARDCCALSLVPSAVALLCAVAATPAMILAA
jgi:hypothetical protein